MSKFLNYDDDEEQQEQEEELEQVQEEQQEVKQEKQEAQQDENKKDKKKKKKPEEEEDLDKLLGLEKKNQQENEMDEEARLKAEKKKEKKQRQAEKKAQQIEQPQAQPQQQPAKKGKDTKKHNPAAQKALELKRQKEEEMQRIKEEQERLEREENERIAREEELERQRQAELEQKRIQKQLQKQQLKNQGDFKTKKQIEEEQKQKQFIQNKELITDVTSKSNVVKKRKYKPGQQQEQQKPEEQQQIIKQEDNEEIRQEQPQKAEIVESWEQYLEADDQAQEQIKKQEEQKKIQLEKEEKEKQQSNAEKNKKSLLGLYQQVGELRSPVCCILGHVDTGKTTLLDKIRNTNVQEGEAGGITQQIGATFFPAKKLQEELTKTSKFFAVECKVPGLLIIDTPGHESFSNLRSRGSSLADLAILVVDLQHGLEKQTIESLELLKARKTPFVIALNKIDRCVEWKKKNMGSSYVQLQSQTKNCKADYEFKKQQVFTQLAEQGFNVALYWENEDPQNYISVVPTSGVTGEGIPDLLTMIVKCTTIYLKNRIKVKKQFNCTVLEKKVTEGHGTTIDCLLVDGIIKKDDRIAVAGFNGPIITKIKALLTPHPMKEMRVKGEYIYHDQIFASMGLKISAPNLEDAMVGSQIYLIQNQDDQDRACKEINHEMEEAKKYIILQNQGVGVAASTLGSLEALLQYLNSNNIPVSYVSVGPVSKDDVMKALKNVLTEDPAKRKKEFACMLVFDIKVLPDAVKFAEENQIKIFEANIIYHLFDKFMKHVQQVKDERKKKEAADVVFPSVLKIVKVINSKEPVILGVEIEQGILKPGTPICQFNEVHQKLGIVETIEYQNKSIKEARYINGAVAIRLGGTGHIQAGKTFIVNDRLCSLMTRRAIDILKEHYREDLSLEDWGLVKELKTLLQIV